MKAVKDFFSNSQILKEVNNTIITLLPKVQSPCRVTDYQPISCCNVIYKCISKIITTRIKGSLEDVVSANQSAFIPEMMKNYHLNRGTPRCSFKVDIQKACDTVDWNFLEATLICFGYPRKMVKGRRGLRQGDPMSPYLFTLVMEVLTLMLQRNVSRRLRNFFVVFYGAKVSSKRIQEYHLSDSNIWEVAARPDSAWSWRRLLHIRQFIRKFLVFQIGDGKTASSCEGPTWPLDRFHKFTQLRSIAAPQLSNSNDMMGWRDNDAVVPRCSVSIVWNSIRSSASKVPWFDAIWFSQGIPKHAFVTWLLVGERVKTYEKLKAWELKSNPILECVFCKQCIESHAHLFFECRVTSHIWDRVSRLIHLPNQSFKWRDIFGMIMQVPGLKSVKMVVAKLCFAATVYFIWQEINWRIFRKSRRLEDQVYDVIYSNVRLKLMTVIFKPSGNVDRLKMDWHLG
ncbi:uncharacterized protein [Rutidosis leptorrhynchoides]|uniref:uncharacterized protein n=1 Tax=Rutidosis leptorrhynchoides TaxID=125765 RepID=UPI003A99A10A